jgi:sucrose phosphorylase
MALLQETNVGRDINRPYLSKQDVEKRLQLPVVRGLIKLIKIRNSCSAFNGDFSVQGGKEELLLSWSHGPNRASLKVNFRFLTAIIDIVENTEQNSYDVTAFIEI